MNNNEKLPNEMINYGQNFEKDLEKLSPFEIKNNLIENGALGAVIFTQQILEDAGLTEEEIGNVVDTPRGVEGVLVGISSGAALHAAIAEAAKERGARVTLISGPCVA